MHRDIKPANIMLTPAGAKVLDFGIAAAVGSHEPDPDNRVMGTPAYVAPERFEGLPATPASDMYSLGVLLYHCLSGRLPWLAGSLTELVHAQRHLDPDPLPHIDGLAPEVLDLCSRCLHRDPAERPTALVEAVDARVYVPLMTAIMPRPSAVSAWDARAAQAPTNMAVPGTTEPADEEPVVTDPVVTDPVVTGPVVTGPVVTGPVGTGAVGTGPVGTGPVEGGPGDGGPVVGDRPGRHRAA